MKNLVVLYWKASTTHKKMPHKKNKNEVLNSLIQKEQQINPFLAEYNNILYVLRQYGPNLNIYREGFSPPHHLFSYHQFTEEKHFPPLYTSFLASVEIVIFLREDEISCKLLNSIIEAATILLRSMDQCLYCPDYFQSYNPQFQNIVHDTKELKPLIHFKASKSGHRSQYISI